MVEQARVQLRCFTGVGQRQQCVLLLSAPPSAAREGVQEFGQRNLNPGETRDDAAATAVSASASETAVSATAASVTFDSAADSAAAANEKDPLTYNIDPIDQLNSLNKMAPSQMLKLLTSHSESSENWNNGIGNRIQCRLSVIASHPNHRNVQLVPVRGKGTHSYQI